MLKAEQENFKEGDEGEYGQARVEMLVEVEVEVEEEETISLVVDRAAAVAATVAAQER